jgi:4-amino-4-deoxy-L-arabinose transferase-like glycosyltransferase
MDKPHTTFRTRSKPVLGVLSLLTLGLFLASAYLFRDSTPFAWVTLLVAVGLVGLLVQQHPLPYGVTWRIEPHTVHPYSRANRLLTGLGIVFLLLAAEVNGQVFQLAFLQQVHYLIQFALLLGGIALVVVGLSRHDWHWPDLPHTDMLFLAGIIILALGLRWVLVDTTIHRFVDEINFIDAIPRLWDNPNTAILRPFSDVTAFTWLYPILQNMTSGLLGTNLVGLRAVSAIFGTLTIPALYFLARTLFHDRLLALLAALALAVFPPHIHFSRIGINNIADPLFGTLALAFLIRGLQSHRRADFVVAGAALGLTQYFYEGGRLLFPGLVMLMTLIYGLMRDHKRQYWKSMAWMLLTACLVAAPVYYTLAANHAILMPRLYNESIEPKWYFSLLTYNGTGASDWLAQRFADPLLLYIARPDSGWFYGGYQPLILPAVVPFFLLGFAALLWKLRSPAAILLLLWIALTSLGNSFLRESASSPRYVVVFPALALLIALGLRYALSFLDQEKRGRVMVGGLVVIALMSGQVFYYFHDHIPALNQQLEQPEEWEDALFRLATLPAGTQAHFIMESPVRDFNVSAFVRFWRVDVQVDVQSVDAVTDDYLQSLDPDAHQAFFVSQSQTATLVLLRQHFTLSPPRFSPYAVPPANQLALYQASGLQP